MSDFTEGPKAVGTNIELPVLKALLTISEAVSRANFFDEVLEVIAQEALGALNAASLAISRWEPDRGVLRTLINVGDLAPHELRWPQQECYAVGDDPDVMDLLAHGRSYCNSVDDENCPPHSRQLLLELGKECELAVSVMSGDSMWGEIWVSGTDGRRFDHEDAQLLQAIAAHTAIAIGRSELPSTVWGYAYQDPLTGIANRRAMEQRFTEIDWENKTPAVLLCDLDGFKQVNDRDGHPAGDDLLRRVATALSGLVGQIEGAAVARLGGDEFCVLLPDATLETTQEFAENATRVLNTTLLPGVSVSWGAAVHGVENTVADSLLAAADAALLEAKRQGRARYSASVPTSSVPAGLDRRDRRMDSARSTDHLTATMVRLMEDNAHLSEIEALEMLVTEVQRAAGLSGWAISVVSEDGTAVDTPRKVDTVFNPTSGLTVLTDHGLYGVQLADYPATERAVVHATTFLAAIGLPGSDAAEVAMLKELGYQAVLGVGVHSACHRYLLELFSHDGHHDLVEISPLVQVLAAYCLSKSAGPDAGSSHGRPRAD